MGQGLRERFYSQGETGSELRI